MEVILFNIQCDVPNKNGRIYPRAVVEQMVARMNDTDRRPLLIHAGRPESASIPLHMVAGIVEGGRITEDDMVMVQYKRLNTDMGPILDYPHDLISVGLGKVTDGVVSDYTLHAMAAILPEEEK